MERKVVSSGVCGVWVRVSVTWNGIAAPSTGLPWDAGNGWTAAQEQRQREAGERLVTVVPGSSRPVVCTFLWPCTCLHPSFVLHLFLFPSFSVCVGMGGVWPGAWERHAV